MDAVINEIEPQHQTEDIWMDHVIHMFQDCAPFTGSRGASGSTQRRVQRSIYRVPEHIRQCDRDAYQPQVVSIGPFYHPAVAPKHAERLRRMQEQKWNSLWYMLGQRNVEVEQVPLPDYAHAGVMTGLDKSRCEDLYRVMKVCEEEARVCYSESFPSLQGSSSSKNDFAEMMLLDGCMVIRLLLTLRRESRAPDWRRRSVAYLSKGQGRLWIWKPALYDLLLLENQIPMFVIEKLFDILLPQENERISVKDLALALFVRLGLPMFSSRAEIIGSHLDNVHNKEIHHLLHLFYLSILPPMKPDTYTRKFDIEKRHHWIPSATELQEVGIKFAKGKKINFRSFLDIRFEGNVMEIPSIEIYDYNKSLLRNLIAFEQCYPDTEMHVTTYAMFMDCIMKTSKDVELLRRNQIIVDKMGTEEEVIRFFTRLNNRVHVWRDVNYLEGVFTAVMEYRESRWHKFCAGFKNNYLSSPWVVASTAAAFVLLLLTLVQAFMAVYSYIHPRK